MCIARFREWKWNRRKFQLRYWEAINILCEEKHQVKRHTVITESAKAIELILNNYVANTDKANIVKQYETVIRRQEDIDSMLDDFGIEECVAKFKEMKAIGFKTGVIVQNLSIFNSFRKNYA